MQPPRKGQVQAGVPIQQASGQDPTAQAVGNLGRAVEQTGDLAMALQEEQDRQDLADAELIMRRESERIANDLATNQRPSEHKKLAMDRFDSAISKVLQGRDFRPSFQRELERRLSMFAGAKIEKIGHDADLIQLENGSILHDARIDQYLADGDFDGAKSLAQEGAGIYYPEEVAQSRMMKIDQMMEDREAQIAITENPSKWLEDNQEPAGNFSEWASRRSMAKRLLGQKKSEETDNAINAIWSGDLNDPDLIEEMTPNLSERARIQLRAELRNKAELDAEGIRTSSVYQGQLSGALSDAFREYKAKSETERDTDAVMIKSMIAQIADPYSQDEFERQFRAIQSGQREAIDNAKDAAIDIFESKIEAGVMATPAPREYEGRSLASFIDSGFLEDTDRLASFGFNEDQVEAISEAAAAQKKDIRGDEEYDGPDPLDLVRSFWEEAGAATDDFPEMERAVFEAIRADKGRTTMVLDPTEQARSQQAQREFKQKQQEREGKARLDFYRWLGRNQDASPERIEEEAETFGVSITAAEIADKMELESGGPPDASLNRIATSYLGAQEFQGASNNPQILKWLQKVNPGVKDDSTAWCSAFCNAVAEEAGLERSNKLNARSWLKVGSEVDPKKAQQGDVAIFWRENKSSWKGHVGFFQGYDSAGNVRVLGGNQGDAVSIKTYPANRLLGFRRLNPE